MSLPQLFLLRGNLPPNATVDQKAALTLLYKSDTPASVRFAAGHRLANVGDPRPGVGLKNNLPNLEWVEVPGGEYVYQEGEISHTLPTFYIARYPITVLQYTAFITAGGYTKPTYWTAEGWRWRSKHNISLPILWEAPKWHLANHPIVGVTWYEAIAFTTWLAEQLGLPPDAMRLPSEFEWEKAARGIDGRAYPWGLSASAGAANINETYAYSPVGENYLKRTCAVGAFSGDMSPFGVMDMCGNVREWTLTRFHDYGRVVRGGCWFSNSHQAQNTHRNWFYEQNSDPGLGFRLVTVVPPMRFYSN
jgi:formylglycine-generating enzyme required for sulfatase activity